MPDTSKSAARTDQRDAPDSDRDSAHMDPMPDSGTADQLPDIEERQLKRLIDGVPRRAHFHWGCPGLPTAAAAHLG